MLTFGSGPSGFTLDAQQLLDTPRDTLFPFFAAAENLEQLTPPFLRFAIQTPPPIVMGEGTLIDYRITLRIFPMTWRTLISAWEPPVRFVDEQVRGPYSLWRHEHRFEARGNQTLVIDHVDYRVLGGRLVNALIVRPDLQSIFRYRQEQMAARFGAVDAA